MSAKPAPYASFAPVLADQVCIGRGCQGYEGFGPSGESLGIFPTAAEAAVAIVAFAEDESEDA
jgi:hypothetical protein